MSHPVEVRNLRHAAQRKDNSKRCSLGFEQLVVSVDGEFDGDAQGLAAHDLRRGRDKEAKVESRACRRASLVEYFEASGQRYETREPRLSLTRDSSLE